MQHLLDHVMSGGVFAIDALFHVGQHDLPFSGVCDSEMDRFHGKVADRLLAFLMR